LRWKNKERELERQRIDQESKRIDFEKQKAELEQQRWLAEREEKQRKEEADQKRREEDLALQKSREERQDQLKNDNAAKAKKYGDAIRGSIIPMGQDPLDAAVFFRRAEQLFVDFKIPKEFQAKVISPFLSAKARAILAKLSSDVTGDYASMKSAILRELQLSSSVYLERFNTCGKATDETYVSFASKLRSILEYYLESRCVKDFDELCELLVCDRIKATLSESCLKYVLSIESGKEGRNWLPVKELTSSIDKFVASRADTAKPRAFALGQTPMRGPRPIFSAGPAKPAGPVFATPRSATAGQTGQSGPVAGPRMSYSPHTPLKSITCFSCGKAGHMRHQCPQLQPTKTGTAAASGGGQRYSAKRVAVISGDPTSDVKSSKPKPQKAQQSVGVDTATDTEVETACNVNHVGVMIDECVMTDECIMTDESLVCGNRDVQSVDTIVQRTAAVSVDFCHPISQISALTYTDVIIKRDGDDDLIVTALVDTGAQVPVIKADLVKDQKPEVMGRIKLQPFVGDTVEADWIRLKIRAKAEHGVTKTHTIDCAVVPNLNEQFIITADVMSCLSRDVSQALIASNVSVSDADNDMSSDCDNDNDDNNDVVDDDVSNVTDNVDGNVAGDDDGRVTNDDSIDETEASSQQVAKEQREDETLKGCFKLAASGKGGFLLLDNLLYHKKSVMGEVIFQLVVPQARRKHVLELGHNNFGGHMAERKTRERIEFTFYWPTLQADCCEYVKTCPTCQLKKRKSKRDRVPITAIPRCDRVFDHLFIDCCGPLISGEGPKPKFNFGLVAIDSYSRFPFCVPLKSLHAKNVCEALLEIWQFTGVSSHLSSDLGTNFTSQLTRELEKQMGCSPRFNSPFHPNATGLVERAVGNIKSIVGKLASEKPNQWHRFLPSVLWALREAKNITTGVSPWSLVFGRVPSGPLTILKNHWVGTQKLPVSFGKTATEYLQDVQKRLELAEQYATAHAEKEQQRYQKYYNLRSADKHFEVGEDVLVLVPDNTASKLFSRWCPAKVLAKRSPYSYEVELNGTKRHYHANQLRKYYVRVESVLYDSCVYDFDESNVGCDSSDNNSDVNSVNSCAVIYASDDDFGDVQTLPTSLQSPKHHDLPSSKIDPESIKHLSQKQQKELLALLDEYSMCFSELPGFTSVVTHNITLLDGFKPKRLPAYRVPERLKAEVSRQIREMLDNGIIRPSQSPMASPLVCVMKGRDGCDGVRLAVDYRYVNKYTRDDAYPMPDLQSIFQSVSKSKIITVCDMKSGYWQLPCNDNDVWLTAFVCDDGIFEFLRCPFGMKNSGASFVRAVSQILSPVRHISKSFVDDVAVHSDHWRGHLADLRQFLEVVKQSGLTLNLKKCKWAHSQVKFCGKIIGSGKILADPDKLSVLDKLSPPKTKRELRRALGFFGYFRDHLPNYAEIAKPLTDLTAKKYNAPLPWGEPQQMAFDKLKVMLRQTTEKPLYAADFFKPFFIYTDASSYAVSSAIMQSDEGGKQFPVAFSSQKLTETQRKWPVIEREAYAVLCALRKHRAWFLGNQEITVCLDHNPLTYLTETVPKNARLIRWALSLQEMPVKFQYYPGHRNVVADYLSRVNDQ